MDEQKNQQHNRANSRNWLFRRRPEIQNNLQQPIVPIANPTAAQKSEPPKTALTQEEIEFDAQFKKWEQEFDNWKIANVHHPDKNAYRQYEQQFESVREKLLQRRTEMQKKKAVQQLLVNPPKTETQLKFESGGIAKAQKAEASKPAPEPQPSTSKASNPPIKVENAEEKASTSGNSTTDLVTNSAQRLKNKNVMELLQSELNKPKPPKMDQHEKPHSQAGYSARASSGPARQRQLQIPYRFEDIQPRTLPNHSRFNQILMNQQNFAQNQNFRANQNRGGKENINYNSNRAPPPDPSYENVPTFTPAKIIDYKHEHMPTFDEQLMEFKVCRVTDYNHITTARLQDFIRDVEVDRIIEKRKHIALRKRTLEYLRSAERLEDTVSNPTYPKGGWVVINQGVKPALKNKRKKKKTPKILRILASKDEAWTTRGYDGVKNMELDDISSSSDGDFAEETRDVTLINTCEPSGTLPCINKFLHKKVMDIKDLLWNPAQLSRPSRISIVLRGAPGSGKSHLTQLIRKKETEMGNNGVHIVSINDFLSEDDDEPEMGHLQQMLKLVENKMKDSICTFIIIDAENCDLTFYHQFYQVGTSNGFTTYTIELCQKLETCLVQNIHKKSMEEIQAAIDTLNMVRIPSDHTLLLPLELYKEYNCVVNPKAVAQDDVMTKNEEKEPCDEMEVDEVEPFSVDTSKNPASESYQATSSSNPESGDMLADTDWKIPEFTCRRIVNIADILEEPRRNLRSDRIMIVLRGPPGAGKSFLASLIHAKETEKKNFGAIVISIDDYFIDQQTKSYKYDPSKVQANIASLVSNFETTVQNSSINFVIVDAENIDLSAYTTFYKIGTSYGFKCYTIELYQSSQICFAHNQHNRSLDDIERALIDMKRLSIPTTHTLLDPSSLYPNFTLPQTVETLPLKWTLKVTLEPQMSASEDTSHEMKEVKETDEIHEEFLAMLKQLIMVRGEFFERRTSNHRDYNREIIDIR